MGVSDRRSQRPEKSNPTVVGMGRTEIHKTGEAGAAELNFVSYPYSPGSIIARSESTCIVRGTLDELWSTVGSLIGPIDRSSVAEIPSGWGRGRLIAAS